MYSAEIDWIELWRELATSHSRSRTHRKETSSVARFLEKGQEAKYDPLVNFVLQEVNGQDTVLDVGAGAGRWSVALAKVAKSVTAVEPADDMVETLRKAVTATGSTNVQIVQDTWEDAIVQVHDIAICAHSIYFSPDFAAFIHKMDHSARKRCYIALRLPPCDGVIGELSLKIHGRRHDSCNAIIGYNVLYSMGIYANVFVEPYMLRWTDFTLEQAFARAKRRLYLESTDSYDDLIKETLANRLTHTDNIYTWPDGMRSALLWWKPSTVTE